MSETQKPERIEEIEKRYPNEWLAILVTKVDRNDVPIEGFLLVHSPNHDEVWEKIRGHQGEVFVFFTGDLVPPNMEVVLIGYLSV